MKLPTKEGDLKIVEESACKYKQIGTILLDDKNGTKVETIKETVGNNLVNVVSAIYRRWMMEDVNYSWKKLTQCFRDCELNVLAMAIEKHFQLPPPHQPQEGALFLLTVIENQPHIISNCLDCSYKSV